MVPGIITSILLVLFLAGSAWVWSPRRRGEFEQAARLPLADIDPSGRDRQPMSNGERDRGVPLIRGDEGHE